MATWRIKYLRNLKILCSTFARRYFFLEVPLRRIRTDHASQQEGGTVVPTGLEPACSETPCLPRRPVSVVPWLYFRNLSFEKKTNWLEECFCNIIAFQLWTTWLYHISVSIAVTTSAKTHRWRTAGELGSQERKNIFLNIKNTNHVWSRMLTMSISLLESKASNWDSVGLSYYLEKEMEMFFISCFDPTTTLWFIVAENRLGWNRLILSKPLMSFVNIVQILFFGSLPCLGRPLT